MRSIETAAMLLLALVFQDLPDAAALKKQAQDASTRRQSIQYVREIVGEVTQNGKPVTEVHAGGRRIPVPSADRKSTRLNSSH